MTRQINTVLTGIHQVRTTGAPEWQWRGTPVIYPESKCPFCNTAIRSNGIWFLRGIKHEYLTGALFPATNAKVQLIQPSHPHDTGGGALCLGKNATGIELLAGTPNLRDCPMGSGYIPRWQKRYWNRHDCPEGREYIKHWSYGSAVTDLLQELDRI